MAIIENRKQLMSLLLLCVITSAVIPPPWVEAQPTCGSLIIPFISPCMGYILHGGEIPQACCGGLKTLVDALKSKEDRQIACDCMREVASRATPEQLNRIQAVPDNCNNPLPFPISPTVDCSTIPKRID